MGLLTAMFDSWRANSTCVAWEPPCSASKISKPRSRIANIAFERRVMIKYDVVFYTLHFTDILLQRSM